MLLDFGLAYLFSLSPPLPLTLYVSIYAICKIGATSDMRDILIPNHSNYCYDASGNCEAVGRIAGCFGIELLRSLLASNFPRRSLRENEITSPATDVHQLKSTAQHIKSQHLSRVTHPTTTLKVTHAMVQDAVYPTAKMPPGDVNVM
jgi:hypothetical protein